LFFFEHNIITKEFTILMMMMMMMIHQQHFRGRAAVAWVIFLFMVTAAVSLVVVVDGTTASGAAFFLLLRRQTTMSRRFNPSRHQSQQCPPSTTWTSSTISRRSNTEISSSSNNSNSNNNNQRSKPPSTTSRLKTAVNIPPGEAQRQFRRTIYTHDDWKKHRNQNRFVVYLAAMWKSGMYKNLCQEVLLTASSAALVVYYNAVVGGYTGFPIGGGMSSSYPALIQSDFFPVITLPLSVFYLTSPALSLLLVFRINTSYQRWDEARKYWTLNINRTRDLVRMANAYYDNGNDGDDHDTNSNTEQQQQQQHRQEDLHHVALCTWAVCRAMKRHLSPDEEDEVDFQKELYETLLFNNINNNNMQQQQQQQRQQADMIMAAAHRPNRALQDLSSAIENLPMHFMRKHEIHQAVTMLEDDLGNCERILSSPVPLMYSRHLARFLVVWLVLLPLGLYDTFETSWNHVVLIPATTVISIMLFGIEEIATQLAEPFTILPMQAFCDQIYNGCMEIVSWTPGDNGRKTRNRRRFLSKMSSNEHTSSSFPLQDQQTLMENKK
jgi:ion channel-forming bestrophin family protein